MSERLTTRVGRIISGSMNAIVDAMEQSTPDLVMEQIVREIDGAIDEVRTELGRTTAARHLANTRLIEGNRRHEALGAQIETAMDQSRDDLAEAGIAEQLDIEAQVPVLERTISEHGEKEQELSGYIKALQARKRELKVELTRLVESRRQVEAATASTGAASAEGVAARVARAESAFERVFEKQTGLAGGTSRDAGHAAKLAELEELARHNRIQERLAALKSRPKRD